MQHKKHEQADPSEQTNLLVGGKLGAGGASAAAAFARLGALLEAHLNATRISPPRAWAKSSPLLLGQSAPGSASVDISGQSDDGTSLVASTEKRADSNLAKRRNDAKADWLSLSN